MIEPFHVPGRKHTEIKEGTEKGTRCSGLWKMEQTLKPLQFMVSTGHSTNPPSHFLWKRQRASQTLSLHRLPFVLLHLLLLHSLLACSCAHLGQLWVLMRPEWDSGVPRIEVRTECQLFCPRLPSGANCRKRTPQQITSLPAREPFRTTNHTTAHCRAMQPALQVNRNSPGCWLPRALHGGTLSFKKCFFVQTVVYHYNVNICYVTEVRITALLNLDNLFILVLYNCNMFVPDLLRKLILQSDSLKVAMVM